MSIRLHPDGQALVQGYPVDTMDPHPVGNMTSFFLPLESNQVDLNSIVFPTGSNVRISTKPISIVRKASRTWKGTLTGYTDYTAILILDGHRMVIRGYDDIEEILYIHGIGNIPSASIPISFTTTGIESHIVHSIHLDTMRLETELMVTNNTGIDYNGVSLEVMTSTEVKNRMMYMSEASSTSVDSPIGTIYTIEGPVSLLHGYMTTIAMIDTRVSISTAYDINAPNGTSNGTYVIMMTPPIDIPPGSIKAYRNGKIETSTSIPPIGRGQERRIPLLVVPNVHAKGTISTDSGDGDDTSPTKVNIIGTIYNSQKNTATVRLKYYVGTKKVSQLSPGIKIGDSLVFEYKMSPGSTQKYNYTFTIQP